MSAIDSQAEKKRQRNRERREAELILSFILYFSTQPRQRGDVNICKYLTLYLGHKAQTLIKVRADAMQTRAKLEVAVVLACPTSVIAHVELIAAFRHSGDPQVKLSKERTATCQHSLPIQNLAFPAIVVVLSSFVMGLVM